MSPRPPHSHAAPLLLLLAAALMGCPAGSMGELTNDISEDLSFVDDDQVIYAHPSVNGYGVVRLGVDGSNRLAYFSEDYGLRDVTADASLWVLGNPNNDLFTLNVPGETPRKVEDFDGRVAEAVISPDETMIAVTLHADYDLPQDQQADSVDDTIFLVDPDSHDIEVIESETDDRVDFLSWSEDGRHLYLFNFGGRKFRVDVETEQRFEIDELPNDDLFPVARRTPKGCPVDGRILSSDDEGIYIHADEEAEGEGEGEHLVRLEGRERGFHDYQPTFETVFFTDSCKTVIFEYERTLWVVDVESKIVGELIEGRSAFLLGEAPN